MNALQHFSRTAQRAAGCVIAQYSTSFGLAVTLLGARHRQHVRNVYALVRVADEIVDGVGHEAGLTTAQLHELINDYEATVEQALARGYSTDLVVHAFTLTAREAGIGVDLTRPFFASMRSDLDAQSLDHAEHARYVYGSAEVIGLMCLRIFLRHDAPSEADVKVLEHGARRLGAAFQNINFLRDIGDDQNRLGRTYLPNPATGASETRLSAAEKAQWVASIRSDLRDAERAIALLPRDARAAVRSAHALFESLTDRIEQVSIDDLYAQRVRVPNPHKLWLATRSQITTYREG